MKQYLTPEQTAKLIDLGFEKPSSIVSVEPIYGMGGISVAKAYTIGELMEILFGWYFKQKTQPTDDPMIFYSVGIWRGEFAVNVIEAEYVHNKELIDALFDTLVELKKRGMI